MLWICATGAEAHAKAAPARSAVRALLGRLDGSTQSKILIGGTHAHARPPSCRNAVDWGAMWQLVRVRELARRWIVRCSSWDQLQSGTNPGRCIRARLHPGHLGRRRRPPQLRTDLQHPTDTMASLAHRQAAGAAGSPPDRGRSSSGTVAFRAEPSPCRAGSARAYGSVSGKRILVSAPAQARASRSRLSIECRKVALRGAAGGIGQPLAMLLKMNRQVTELALYDIGNVVGVAADLSHCNTPVKVRRSARPGPRHRGGPVGCCRLLSTPLCRPARPGPSCQHRRAAGTLRRRRAPDPLPFPPPFSNERIVLPRR
jgi:hypothetical protein